MSTLPSARHARARRRRRRTGWVLAGVVGVVGAAGSAAAVGYAHLDANIRSAPLFAGATGNAGTERVDAFGHAPINILVIGSDSRSDAADCTLGGACGPGANADVEMVVHVSADRTNATVMSVPRDTVTELPACTDATNRTSTPAHLGQINSTLAAGPGCTVAAVHQLTGIPIDHFVMVDFAGVVTMSDAVGGVGVCVTQDVYDPYSHLKLAAGSHTLKGAAALAFLRSRHGFGDGSDLGRSDAQHQFLSALVRTTKSAGTLANPTAVYSLADAATKALTVDRGLASITSLAGLAYDLDKVPTSRVTFTTMPNAPDPADAARVVPSSSAATLFAAIADDRPLTSASTSTASTPPSSTGTGTSGTASSDLTAQAATLAVAVRNDSGATGRATVVSAALVDAGFRRASVASSTADRSVTTVLYPSGHRSQAALVAAALGIPTGNLQQGDVRQVTVLIGSDWTTGSGYPGGATGTAAAGPTTLAQAHAQTADRSGTCTAVSQDRTVVVGGVAMTPSQAFAASPQVPLSAP